MTFEDHFSRIAGAYAGHRPRYPCDLYEYLASLTSGHALAWDCATGNGQAAVDLADYYERVFASDASADQVSQALPHARIDYRVEPAEQSSLADGSVDLITVAIAVHWFDFERFYQEARRVLKPGGILAVWTYHRPMITPEIDALIVTLDEVILAGFWPDRIHYLREHYLTLPFPFDELPSPEFAIEADWQLDQMLGFINSWSAVRRYQEQHGVHPFSSIWDRFLADWGEQNQSRHIQWPLYLRIGSAAG